MDNKHYLSKVMPRFYRQMKDCLDNEWPELSPQLDGLVIIDRCSCSDKECIEFTVSQTIDKYHSEDSERIYYDTTCKPLYPQIGLVDEKFLQSFEIRHDYEDGYINFCLNNIGMYLPEVKDD